MRIVAFGLLGLVAVSLLILGPGQSPSAEDRARATLAARGTPIPPGVPGVRQAVPNGPPGSQGAEAHEVCRDFVLKRLTAPATSKFAAYTPESVRYIPSGGSYEISSHVDAQNTFGALVRTRYSCRVYPKGGDNWALIELTTSP